MKAFEESPPHGWIYTTSFRSVTDPNDIWMSVVFESEELYKKMRTIQTWIGNTERCFNT